MPAHCSRNASARRRVTGHITTIADVRAAACLVGSYVVRADYLAVVFCDERLSIAAHPIGQSIAFTHVAIQRIGCAFANNGLDYLPDR